MQSDSLLNVREDSFERIRGVGDVQIRVIKVDEEVWKVPLHAVVGAANSAMRVVPSSPTFIRSSLLEKLSPLVMPESQPVRKLRFRDFREESHECLQILSRLELRSPCDIARHNRTLMEMTHLHRHGKALQQATSAVTDDGFNPPSLLLQRRYACLVFTYGFVRKKLPEKVLVTMRTPPHHDAEEPPEVCGVHNYDDCIGSEFLPLDDNRH